VIILSPLRHGKRTWATERKHPPDVDLAAVGDWRTDRPGPNTPYQQEDAQTMLRVVLEAGELREARQDASTYAVWYTPVSGAGNPAGAEVG
jgi:hypothetical protein